MPLRSEQDLLNRPCMFKLRDFVKSRPGQGIQKVRKQVPKLDANGNIIYKTVLLPEKKGCGCKANTQHLTGRMIEQQVPETIEVWVDEQIIEAEQKLVLCKLFGQVPCTHCQNCKTYKQ